MSIDVETIITYRCGDCRRKCDADDVTAYCPRCTEKRKAEAVPARGSEVRAWADRKKLLGQITAEQADFLEFVAKDLDLAAPPASREAA